MYAQKFPNGALMNFNYLNSENNKLVNNTPNQLNQSEQENKLITNTNES